MNADNRAPRDGGCIRYTVADRIATIEIDNPAHRNALTAHMCRSLVNAAAAADADGEVDVVVLRGSGGHFSAGAAIDEVLDILYPPAAGSEVRPIDLLSAADAALCAIRKPLVSVVEGVCMGGGWQIAATADLVVADANARFAVTPAKLGIVYPQAGLERLVVWAGPARAKSILLTGESFDAVTAERWGLVTEVAVQGGLEERVMRILTTLKARSQYSAIRHKQLVDSFSSGEASEPGYGEKWRESLSGVLTAGDLAEGRAAFLEKRSPAFPWRVE